MRDSAMFTGEMGEDGLKVNHEDGSPLFHALADGTLHVFGPKGNTIFTTNTADRANLNEGVQVAALLDEAYEEEGFGFMAINAFFQIAKAITQLVSLPEEAIAEMLKEAHDSSKPH